MMRILIVDDHAILRRGLTELLARDFPDAKFGEAADAREAVEQVRQRDWDVVLLDIILPGRSGLDVIGELIRIRPKLRIIILSANAETQFGTRALKAGAAGFV